MILQAAFELETLIIHVHDQVQAGVRDTPLQNIYRPGSP